MIPLWVQAFFVVGAVLIARRVIASARRREWVTIIGSVKRDERPLVFWSAMAMGIVVALLLLNLAIGSVAAGR